MTLANIKDFILTNKPTSGKEILDFIDEVKVIDNKWGVFYSKNGKYHREDGPAKIYPNGSKCWYQNGKLHRTDGPAVIWSCGTSLWYINGKKIHDPR